MANKMTQRDYYNEIIALAKENDRADLVEFAEGRIEAINKKIANKKATKTQEENEGYKAEILKVLDNGNAMTVSEIIKASDVLAGFSNQKVSALVRQLVEAGSVIRAVDGKRTLFSLATAE